VYFPICPGFATRISSTTPAGSALSKRLNLTVTVPTLVAGAIRLSNLVGQPRPRQATVIPAPGGASTDSSLSFIPELDSAPTMRTIGNGSRTPAGGSLT
jgi:hypothetical protein